MKTEKIRQELEALQNLSLKEQASSTKKKIFYPYLYIVAGLLLGWLYASFAPFKYKISEYAFNALKESDLLAHDSSFYDIISPVLGFTLIVVMACVLCFLHIKSFKQSWSEYNSIIERAKSDWALQKQKDKEQAIQKKKDDLKAKCDELVSLYGECTRHIVIGDKHDIDQHIFVFGETEKIRLLGQELNFSDVIGVELKDTQTIIKGKIHSETKTNGSNMVKRAVVGDILLGEAGAVIGGATAKKNTIATQDPDIIKHDYSVFVNIRDIKQPIVRIHTAANETLTSDLVALFNAIIASK